MIKYERTVAIVTSLALVAATGLWRVCCAGFAESLTALAVSREKLPESDAQELK